MVSFRTVLVALGAALLFQGACAAQGGGAKTLHPGNLRGVSLVDVQQRAYPLFKKLKENRATVLVWWSSSCPCVARYRGRVEALRKSYVGKSVAFLAVASNADDARQDFGQNHKLWSLPLIIDKGGKLAALLGVGSTPTTAILDQRAQLRYYGWLDNERKPGEAGRVAYLDSALRQVLAGNTVSRVETPVYGCRISRSLGEPSSCSETCGKTKK